MDDTLNWFLSACRGAFDGIWLGLLNDRRLNELDRAYYDAEPIYLDESYNRSGLHDWEQHIVDEYFALGSRVAVVGAGGGREVIALLAQGHDAKGYEPNPELAAFGSALAAADGAPDRVVTCSREGWPVAAVRGVDAVLVGWGAYMLIRGRNARVRFLRGAAAACGDGPIVVSFFVMPSDRVQFRAAAAVSRRLARLRRAEAPLLGDALAPNYVHFFTRAQIIEEFNAAGLELIAHGTGGIDVDGYGWAVGRHSRNVGPGSQVQ